MSAAAFDMPSNKDDDTDDYFGFAAVDSYFYSMKDVNSTTKFESEAL
jgi:hypothetical protein